MFERLTAWAFMRVAEEKSRYARIALWVIPLVAALENTGVQQIPHPWFVIYLYRGVPIVFGLALLFWGMPRLLKLSPNLFEFRLPFVGVHLTTVALFCGVEWFLWRSQGAEDSLLLHVAIGVWLLLIPLLVISLIAVFLKLSNFLVVARSLGSAWGYAALVSVLVVILRELLRVSWDLSSSPLGHILQTASFLQAKAILSFFYPDVVSDIGSHALGTSRFAVEVSGTCSGIEGMALISAVMLVWYLFARRELRIGRALLLAPIALTLMWLLNLVRLVTLIMIGSAGFEQVAMNGFHTEAGWIALVLVSFLFVLAAQHIGWLRRDGDRILISHAALTAGDAQDSRNLATIYILPFTAITAAAILGQTVSAGFDWLYPLRFAVALAALWLYRAEYRRMDWKFGPLGIAAGLAVAAVWLFAHDAVSGWSGGNPASIAVAEHLHQLPLGTRTLWMAVRVIAASTTVPIAEELAFRGYIARRIIDADVESVPFSRLDLRAIAGSSLAFGLMHGRMWVVGVAAGIVFAVVARTRNRLGEAVAAHVTANLILALVAVTRSDFTLW